MFGSMTEEVKGVKEKTSKDKGMANEVESKPDKGAIIIIHTTVFNNVKILSVAKSREDRTLVICLGKI